VQVKLNGTEYFRKTISATGTLDAQVLFLGGPPQFRPVRQANDNLIKIDAIPPTTSAVIATPLSNVHFKGIIQDVQVPSSNRKKNLKGFEQKACQRNLFLRPDLTQVAFGLIVDDLQISNGSSTMVVEFFPLNAEELDIPMFFGNVQFDETTVLEGVRSDNSCRVNPCQHNGVCENTWNDYR
jgi:protein crumbs